MQIKGIISGDGSWRDLVGKLCAAGLAYNTIGISILNYLNGAVNAIYSLNIPPIQAASTEELVAIMAGILGLGGFRTIDKKVGNSLWPSALGSASEHKKDSGEPDPQSPSLDTLVRVVK